MLKESKIKNYNFVPSDDDWYRLSDLVQKGLVRVVELNLENGDSVIISHDEYLKLDVRKPFKYNKEKTVGKMESI